MIARVPALQEYIESSLEGIRLAAGDSVSDSPSGTNSTHIFSVCLNKEPPFGRLFSVIGSQRVPAVRSCFRGVFGRVLFLGKDANTARTLAVYVTPLSYLPSPQSRKVG